MTKRKPGSAAAPRRTWSPIEIDELRARYPHELTSDLATRFGRTTHQVSAKATQLGLRKTLEYQRMLAARSKLAIAGTATRFKPGQTSWSAGLRRPGYAPGRMAETQFKKGQYPDSRWDREAYGPGALRVTTDNELLINVGVVGEPRWVLMRRYAWWSETGHWPRRNQIVRTINGDPHDCRFENLDLISQVENMRRNSVHNLPKDLQRAVQLLGAVKRQINKREGKGNEQAQHR